MTDTSRATLGMRSLPRFTPELEHEAFVRLRFAEADGEAGKTKADELRDEIMRRNLPLVVQLARKYLRPNRSFDDLVADGCVGLVESISRFDHNRKNADGEHIKFSTFASKYIFRDLRLSAAFQDRMIRCPAHMRLKYTSDGDPIYHHRFSEFVYRTGIVGRIDSSNEDDVLFEAIRFVGGQELPQDRLERHDWLLALSQFLEHLIEALPPKKRAVIRDQFGFNGGGKQKLRVVAAKHGVSKQRIKQIESEVIAKLKREIRLSDFADKLAIEGDLRTAWQWDGLEDAS